MKEEEVRRQGSFGKQKLAQTSSMALSSDSMKGL